jgi:enterochelin esterase family protein
MRTKLRAAIRAVAHATVLLATWSATAQPPVAGQRPPPIVSPEISAERDVTLRLRAPHADQVMLTSGGDIPGVPFQTGLPLAKGAEGVWQVKLPSLESGAYRYRFDVDGVATTDPSTPLTSQANGNAWSLFYVPGAKLMDSQQVPHGAVAEVTYHSTVIGRDRRMHVYTPPGYERGRDSYPVLYLLHGAGDSDDAWSTVGRAGFILDNLIAAGDAVPMIVVMPDGHTAPFSIGVGRSLNIADFVREFTADIKPHVEASYRVRGERASTAIAGLSMGGAQTLDIAIGNLDDYAYVGVFSSGVFGIGDNANWEESRRAQLANAVQKRGLDLVWFSTGKDDFLIETTRATVAMLERHGFDVVYEESAGGHTWDNWREYLGRFAPLLFK